MTNTQEEYNKLDLVNNTSLSYLKKSFGHYTNFLKGNTKQTEPMRLGIALHEAILEPEKFMNNFEVKLARIGKGIDQEIKEQKERCELEKKHLITQTEFEMFKGIAETLHKDSFITNLLQGAEIELTLTWDYKNKKCKGRLDGIKPMQAIFDFKFVADAQPYKFKRNALFYGYHRQAFWYREGAIQNGLIDKNCPYYIIAVEKVLPYAYSIIEVDETMLLEGKQEADSLLKKLDEYYESSNKENFYGFDIWQSEKPFETDIDIQFSEELEAFLM